MLKNKIYLYTKEHHEAKCQLLINKCGSVVLKHSDHPNVSIEYSNDMNYIHENIDKDNLNEKRKILIYLIADMLSS